MMDDDRRPHIGESIDAYIRTHKIDDLFTRMLSATLSERPDNAREYIRKLCSNDNIKEENDTTKMMKELLLLRVMMSFSFFLYLISTYLSLSLTLSL